MGKKRKGKRAERGGAQVWKKRRSRGLKAPDFPCIIHIDPTRPREARIGFGMFAATLAYPNDSYKRMEYASALIAAMSSPIRRGPGSHFARLWKVTPRRLRGILSVGSRQLEKRYRAIWSAWQVIASKSPDVARLIYRESKYLAPAKNITKATDAEMLFGSLGRKWHQADLMHRVWAPSKPVLHMAIAWLRTFNDEWLKVLLSETGQIEWLEVVLADAKFWKENLPKSLDSWDPSKTIPIIVFRPGRNAELI